MLENVQVLYHSSVKINKEKVIYVDPFKIDRNYNDADIIFITHNHYDHYSEEDIDKIWSEKTIIVAPKDMKKTLFNKYGDESKIVVVEPEKQYEVNGVKFSTVWAYNVNKHFHPKENNWVGYVIELDGIKYYIAGDTDITEENKKVKCDVAFVPVGGTYTMTAKEAASLVNIIKPKIAVPIHYGSIVGTNQDAIDFVNMIDSEIDGKILM